MKADKERLYRDVEFLTSLRPYRNFRNLQSLEATVAYIQKELKSCGAVPQIQQWEADSRIYKNVIASYNEEKSQRLVVGAHYDVAARSR